MRAHITSILNNNSIRAIFLKRAKFNNRSRNNWKPLFEVNFSKNSAYGLINYHLIENLIIK